MVQAFIDPDFIMMNWTGDYSLGDWQVWRDVYGEIFLIKE